MTAWLAVWARREQVRPSLAERVVHLGDDRLEVGRAGEPHLAAVRDLGHLLVGGLLVGANAMQRVVQVPSALIIALNGLVVIFVVSTDRYKRLLRDRASAAETAAKLAEQEEQNKVAATVGAVEDGPPDRAGPNGPGNDE